MHRLNYYYYNLPNATTTVVADTTGLVPGISTHTAVGNSLLNRVETFLYLRVDINCFSMAIFILLVYGRYWSELLQIKSA